MTRAVVVGAGIGGLTTAAVLARSGVDVTVLEAQVYPGGCAATFYHQGYRFDSGATLAGGFYPGGPMSILAQVTGIDHWPARLADTAMVVHLPDGSPIARCASETRWDMIRSVFGYSGIDFFRWQERTADSLWDLALRLPAWPPQSLSDLGSAATKGIPWLLQGQPASLAVDAFRTVSSRMVNAPENLKLFVDAQLLISAQAESERANALYGAAALDLPRRGVAHPEGGIGAIAEALVDAIRKHGGRVLFRQEVTHIHTDKGRLKTVETRRGERFPADVVVTNLTPWNAKLLLAGNLPEALRRLPPRPEAGWGAFVVYVGLDNRSIPQKFPLHHQIILRRPLGEGNTVFASLSPEWDSSRAPAGQRALTLSTHTALEPWWHLYEHDRTGYEKRKAVLTEKLLDAVGKIIPNVRDVSQLVLPGTPVTFERFTRRRWGWVGGFPQTGLLRNLGPRLAPNLWLVGDSIFPGQSTAAVALGGLRVSGMILQGINP